MSVFEIALPKLTPDAELIKTVEKDVRIVINLLKASPARNGLRGWIVSENGRDVKADFREILVLEWPEIQDFHNFVASDGFQGFIGLLKSKGLVQGPTELKIFDAENPSQLFASHPVLEYLVIKPRNTSNATGEDVLHQLKSQLAILGSSKAVVGSSTNLEPKEIAAVGLYTSDAELEKAQGSSARQALLQDIGKAADVTTIVAHVSYEFGTEKGIKCSNWPE
ncbi:hypothetical protein GGR57DRAFT_504787 [Xylariaceae sp. FL1272]|nr:hypothetical protein GGR57DRAFT_504787 [Xylariaceae sp. FL1272]